MSNLPPGFELENPDDASKVIAPKAAPLPAGFTLETPAAKPAAATPAIASGTPAIAEATPAYEPPSIGGFVKEGVRNLIDGVTAIPKGIARSGALDVLAPAAADQLIASPLHAAGDFIDQTIQQANPLRAVADMAAKQPEKFGANAAVAGQDYLKATKDPLGAKAVADTAMGVHKEAGADMQKSLEATGGRPTLHDFHKDPTKAWEQAAAYFTNMSAQSAPAMLAAMATRNPELASNLMGLDSGVQEYTDLRSQGVDRGKALLGGAVNAAAEKVGEDVAMPFVMGSEKHAIMAEAQAALSAGNRKLAAELALKAEKAGNHGLLKAVGSEAGQEVPTQLIQQNESDLMTGHQTSVQDQLLGALDAGVSGGLMGAGGHAISAAHEYVTTPPAVPTTPLGPLGRVAAQVQGQQQQFSDAARAAQQQAAASSSFSPEDADAAIQSLRDLVADPATPQHEREIATDQLATLMTKHDAWTTPPAGFTAEGAGAANEQPSGTGAVDAGGNRGPADAGPGDGGGGNGAAAAPAAAADPGASGGSGDAPRYDPATSILPTDRTKSDGTPFANRAGASAHLKKAFNGAGQIVPVDGGFVVRPPLDTAGTGAPASAPTDAQSSPAAPPSAAAAAPAAAPATESTPASPTPDQSTASAAPAAPAAKPDTPASTDGQAPAAPETAAQPTTESPTASNTSPPAGDTAPAGTQPAAAGSPTTPAEHAATTPAADAGSAPGHQDQGAGTTAAGTAGEATSATAPATAAGDATPGASLKSELEALATDRRAKAEAEGRTSKQADETHLEKSLTAVSGTIYAADDVARAVAWAQANGRQDIAQAGHARVAEELAHAKANHEKFNNAATAKGVASAEEAAATFRERLAEYSGVSEPGASASASAAQPDATPTDAGASAAAPAGQATAPAAQTAAAAATSGESGASVASSGVTSHEGKDTTVTNEGAAKAAAIDAAAAQAATHPDSAPAAPTEAQKDAGNYQKGHITLHGMGISIENPAGTKRNEAWPPLAHHYGYIKGTIGKDKDHIDVFLTPDAHDASRPVFVIDQRNAKGGFDEHKVIMGVTTADEAKAAYKANYSPGWKGLGAVTQMTLAQFKAWSKDTAATAKPASKATLPDATEAQATQDASDAADAKRREDVAAFTAAKRAEHETKVALHAELAKGAETVTLPWATKGWKGAPSAEISVAKGPNGWHFRSTFQTNNTGAGGPFSDHHYASAAEARAGAIAFITHNLPKNPEGVEKQHVARIRDWMAKQDAGAQAETAKTANPADTSSETPAKPASGPLTQEEHAQITGSAMLRLQVQLGIAAKGASNPVAFQYLSDKDKAELGPAVRIMLGAEASTRAETPAKPDLHPSVMPRIKALGYSDEQIARMTHAGIVDIASKSKIGVGPGVSRIAVVPANPTAAWAEYSKRADAAEAKMAAETPAPKLTVKQQRAITVELERSTFAALANDASWIGKSVQELVAEIRTRVDAAHTPAATVLKMATGIHKQLAKNAVELEKAKHRDPAVYAAKVADAAGARAGEARTQFEAGFAHAMAGRTKSSMVGDHLPDMLDGYNAAVSWRQDEDGKAFFEGRAVSKLANTGVDLKRHMDLMLAELRAKQSDAEKAWPSIEKATNRARLFSSFNFTGKPGFQLYINGIRDQVLPFKEWLEKRWTGGRGWYGNEYYGGRYGSKTTNTEYMLRGQRYPGHLSQSDRETWKSDPSYRADLLQDAAREYLTQVRPLIDALTGAKGVLEAAEGIDGFFDAAKVAAFDAEQALPPDEKPKYQRDRLDIFHALTDEGKRLAETVLGAKGDQYRGLAAYRSGNGFATRQYADKEATAELPTRAQPLTAPKLDKITRTGMTDQRKGRNVTPLEFKTTFGFGDVGFGTWVGSKQDQDHLNYSFDAFMDLANHMGIDPKHIGMGGALHYTIGALGSGGKAAAHFSPSHPGPKGSVQVINVTNTKGDGTVYHEWIHALDHNLSGPDWHRVRSIIQDYFTRARPSVEEVNAYANQFLFGGSYWKGSKNGDKIDAAVKGMDYLINRGSRQTAYKKNADALGADYWGNDKELLARASEAWSGDTLGGANTYLVNPEWSGDGAVTAAKGYRGTPYPTGHERQTFNGVLSALRAALSFDDAGTPTVSLAKFEAALPEDAGNKRRIELKDPANMEIHFNEELAKREAVAQEKLTKAQQAAAAEAAELDRLAQQALAELAPAVVDPPKAGETMGPLTETDLEALFDEVAAEAREEAANDPKAEPPGAITDNAAPAPAALPTFKSAPDFDAWLRANGAGDQLKVKSGDDGVGGLLIDPGKPGYISGATSSRPTTVGADERLVFQLGDGRLVWWDHATGTVAQVDPADPRYRQHGEASRNPLAPPNAAADAEFQMWLRDRAAAGNRPSAEEAKAKRAALANTGPKAPATSATAAALVAEAAKHGVSGVDEAMQGLAAIFGAGKGRLNSFPSGFDEDAYKAAKPHFEKALAQFQEAGKSLKDLFRMLLDTWGDGIKQYAVRFAKDMQLSTNLGQAVSASQTMANAVSARLLNSSEPMDWRELFEMADRAWGGTQGEGVYTPKDAYDALEAGVNHYLQSRGNAFTPNTDAAGAMVVTARLQELMKLLPTQTKRTAEQDEFQQFSTVPPLAFIANWVANVTAGDTLLEPSAGIGGLAVFGKIAGAKLVLNELSSRRAAVLQEVFPGARVFHENAEHIDRILPDDVQPTVVVMNPPFSATAGRLQGERSTKIGAQHVEQALARLPKGGRLVAIVGQGMTLDSPSFRDWWAKIQAKHTVRAVVPVSGKGYAKYGTTFDNVLLVIDKVAEGERVAPIVTPVEDYTQLVGLLNGIRNDRPAANVPATNSTDSSDAIDAAESARADAVPEGEGANDGAATAVGAPAVGAGQPGAGSAVDTGGGRRGGKAGARPGGRAGGSAVGANPAAGNVAGASGNNAAAGSGRPDSGGHTTGVTSGAVDAVAGELTDSTYEGYAPQRLTVEGARPHPGPLVQSSAMASVLPPAPTYTPNLSKETIEGFDLPGDKKGSKGGGLSLAQIEAVVYAGMAHLKLLKDGITRRGFFIGDGTGVGKGREISGIILDNVRQGRTRAVWVSEKQELEKDAKRDYGAVGGDGDAIFNHNKTPAAGDIPQRDGVLFTTYDTLKGGSQLAAATATSGIKPFKKGDVVLNSSGYNVGVIKGIDLVNKTVSSMRYGRTVKLTFDQISSIGGNADWIDQLPKPKTGVQSRLEQLVKWLGPDFDGVIAFDEAHNAGNAIAMKGERGSSKPSEKALAVVELQKQLPNARVVYVSATGATTVNNLAYAPRLGLWGTGTAFAGVADFITKMTAGGLATMELVARDMKQMGAYLARSLSFDGVTYARLEHELTPIQHDIYNKLAEAWQVVLQNMNTALETTGATKDGASQNGKAVAAMRGAFWSTQLRFFNQIVTSMQMPTVLEQIQQDLDAGAAVVLQLVNTNEAAQEKALAKRTEDGDEAEDLDLTPREALMDMVRKAFPVVQMQTTIDSQGNKVTTPVTDSAGKPVENKEAVAARDKLLKDLEQISVPEGPLEQLLNTFGPDVVAEVTGRSKRTYMGDDKDGNRRLIIEKRGGTANAKDAEAFMADKKRILVFSDAGGTGYSFHADKTKVNQRKRQHYLLQPGWRADKAVQGMGRTHRTNQSSAPHYRLVATNIPAHARFLSAIARKLDMLGAMTKGQRDTAGGGLFSEKDNLEGKYAQQAIVQLFNDVKAGLVGGESISAGDKITYLDPDILKVHGQDPAWTRYEALEPEQPGQRSIRGRRLSDGVELDVFLDNVKERKGLEWMDFLRQIGLDHKLDQNTGQIPDKEMPPTRQFLNRMLSLTLPMQDVVFGAFIARMEEKVEVAAQRGELETGMQTVRAQSTRIVQDEVVYTDPETQAETRYVELELTLPQTYRDFPDGKYSGKIEWLVNKASGKVWGAVLSGNETLKDGSVVTRYRMHSTTGIAIKNAKDVTGEARAQHFTVITEEQAREKWAAEEAAKPTTVTRPAHMIVGAMLPIWDRLETAGPLQVMRTQTTDGQRLLGKVILPKDVAEIRGRLNVGHPASKLAPVELMAQVLKGATIKLANGWTIARARVSDELRIELKVPQLYGPALQELRDLGVIGERIDWKERNFIPTGANGAQVLEALLKNKPLVDLTQPGDAAPALQRRTDGGKFASGMTVEATQAVVDRITANWAGLKAAGFRVVVADRVDDLPEKVKRDARRDDPNDATLLGAFDRGTLYIVAANARKGAAGIEETIFHEAYGHAGLRLMFGRDTFAKTIAFAKALGGLDGMLRYAKANGINIDHYVAAVAANDNLTPEMRVGILFDELIAHLAEKGEPTLRQRVLELLGQIKEWLRANGFAELAKYDAADLARLLQRSRQAVQGKTTSASRLYTGAAPALQSREPAFDQAPAVFDRSPPPSSAAFKGWFKASAVTTTSGAPRVVFHGTSEDFWEFKDMAGSATGQGTTALGHFFTEDRVAAEYYAENASQGVPADETVMPVYLSIQKPYALSLADFSELADTYEASEFRKFVEKQGFDGIHVAESGTWIAFKPAQIKSAEFNNGNFDPSDPDIRFSRAPTSEAGATLDGIEASLRNDSNVYQRVKAVLNSGTENWRPEWLGALTLRHIGELAAKLQPKVGTYQSVVDQMNVDRNDMTTKSFAIADRWSQFLGKHPALAEALASLMHDTTIVGVDPSSAFQPGALKASRLGPAEIITPATVNARIQKLTAEKATEENVEREHQIDEQIRELRRKLAEEAVRRRQYPELVARWTDLPAEAKALYTEVRDNYEGLSEATLQALVTRIFQLEATDAQKEALADRMRVSFEEARLQGPYFPLARFGNFWVEARDAGGERAFFMYEGHRQWQAGQKELQNDGYTIVDAGRKIQDARRLDGASGGFVAQVEAILEDAGVDDQTRDDVYQLFLRTLPDLSQRKHFIHRAKVAGYSNDALRAFGSTTFHGAFQVARLKHTQQLANLMLEMKAQPGQLANAEDKQKSAAIYNEMVKRHEWILNPRDSAIVSKISALNFIYYLGMTPAAAIVNLTQTAMIAMPVLGSRFGYAGANRELLAATKLAMKHQVKNDFGAVLNGDEAEAYKTWIRLGIIDVTQAHALAEIGQTDSTQFNRTAHKAMQATSFLFHRAEMVNRQATALAAYRLAIRSGMKHDAATDYAGKATLEAHFDYSNANRARFMQSGTAKVLLAFRQYSLNMTWFLARNAQQSFAGLTREERSEARQKLVGVLGMTSLFAGATGLPLMWAVFGLLNGLQALFGDDDDPWDAETAFKNWAVETFGHFFGSAATEGVGNALGVDLHSRLSLNNIWLREADRDLEGKAAYDYWLEQAAGPVGGMFANTFRGAQLIHEGQLYRGIETMVPKAVRDAMKTVRYATQGVNTLRGDPLLPDVSLAQQIVQFAGFTPAAVAERQDANRAIGNYANAIEKSRQHLMDGFAMAVRMEDQEAVAKGVARIAQWNERHPTMPISEETLQASLAGRQRVSQRSVGGMAVNPRIEAEARAQGAFADAPSE